ncbi:MAG: 3-deoxy-manno-octulosonate cytidylyltransferase [Phycisphaerales bacterium]|nr:3-deoxy-manno-octulosonate cytidylyltransferase [Phycisphaerales bacterium]
MPDTVIIIPARMASERFPGKMLAADTGLPLIRHVYDQARRATCADRVVVATDDHRIAEVIRKAGGETVLTLPDHPNGTSRLGEAAEKLALPDDAVIINVQGDEPEIPPTVIDAAAAALGDYPMATVASPFHPDHDPGDPNIVKVVVREDGRAMYFSRAAIPFVRNGVISAGPWRHVGIYAYRRAFLRHYLTLVPTDLERIEVLEQLRVLEHGYDIAVALRETHHVGIDTRAQYDAFVSRWKQAHASP